jgi:predicted PurR-regulated permease PerM
VAALYFAKDFLIPLAMAVLISFMLAPLVRRLQRLGLGRVASVVLVVVVALCGTGALGYAVGQQLLDLSDQLPHYQSNIVAKLDAVHRSIEPALRKAEQTVAEVNEHLQPAPGDVKQDPNLESDNGEDRPVSPGTEPAAELSPQAAAKNAAVPVKVVSTPTSVPSMFSNMLGSVLGPLGSVAVVAVLVIFMLIQREDLRNRVIRLVGDTQLRLTTQAIDDASTRVSHYLLMQLIINATYGVATAFGLYLVGLPNAILWGLLSGLLRFVPYIGPAIGAAMPLLLSLAVFEGWTRPLLVLGWIVILELISNNVMEPWLYSAGTGVSPLAIIVSAVFWTWLWGGMGLVLSTPITVCLTVIGRHVPQFRFLYVLLGDDPPLELHESFYQRMLALDQDEAADQARDFLKSRGVIELFDEVLIPALRLAEEDRHSGQLDENRLQLMHAAVREIIDDVAEPAIDAAEPPATPADSDLPAAEKPEVELPTALCVPAHDQGDELVALMLTHLLAGSGFAAELVAREAITSGQFDAARIRAAKVIWVSALPPIAEMHARNLCKRLRGRTSATKIMVGFWTGPTSPRAKDQLQRAGAAEVEFTLQTAVEKSVALIAPPAAEEPSEVPHVAAEPSAPTEGKIAAAVDG